MPSSEEPAAQWTSELRGRLDELLDGYRASLHDCLDGLSEEEARLRLVPSKTTLLGLLKHVTYVEGVWFDQAVTGRSYTDIGIASTPDRSSPSPHPTPSPRSKRRIGIGATAHGRPWPTWRWTSSLMVAATARSGR